ncbi:hypothetical protein SZN_19405 [Streptomyces zinciresistens K42]|uniref:Uncharacterized protein n=2 Tax=Streptomyces TaxID=1883 RepID=G2GEE8_9ACTN|nr:hypothetical protein SZN_19405 [Streptomyces zinciresistens K42]
MCGHALLGHAAPLTEIQPPTSTAAAPAQNNEGTERRHDDGSSTPSAVCEREGDATLKTQRLPHLCAAEPPTLVTLTRMRGKAPRGPPWQHLAVPQPNLPHDGAIRPKLQMWLL